MSEIKTSPYEKYGGCRSRKSVRWLAAALFASSLNIFGGAVGTAHASAAFLYVAKDGPVIAQQFMKCGKDDTRPCELSLLEGGADPFNPEDEGNHVVLRSDATGGSPYVVESQLGPFKAGDILTPSLISRTDDGTKEHVGPVTREYIAMYTPSVGFVHGVRSPFSSPFFQPNMLIRSYDMRKSGVHVTTIAGPDRNDPDLLPPSVERQHACVFG